MVAKTPLITINRSHAFRVLVLCISLCFWLYIIASIYMTKSRSNWDWEGKETTNIQKSYDDQNEAYFVNQVGCRMPSFSVMNAHVQQYFYEPKSFTCEKPLLRAEGNHIRFALTPIEIRRIYDTQSLAYIVCTVEPFTRKGDYKNEFHKPVRMFGYGDIIKIDDEFVRVICKDKKEKEIYRDYFYFRQAENITERVHGHSPKEMNVLILGFDSVSRLNFRRQMNETYGLLVNELNAFEMFGYNKVADNTFPNLIPALTGLNVSELSVECLPDKSSTFDGCRFIWDEYKDKNYTTTYVEDRHSLGLFHYDRNGFKGKMTDVNLRPLIMEMEESICNKKSRGSCMCLGRRRTIDVLLENMRRATSAFTSSESPNFAFFWTTSYTHDNLNTPRLIDADITRYIRELSASSVLNNTFLLVMSDHGLRFGDFRNTYQGMIEERQPFLFLIPPQWFAEKYPIAMGNLALNRHRLTTHFDLHETLRDLLNHKSLSAESIKSRNVKLIESNSMPRAISLFLPMPETRTCRDAHIAPHWCTCHERGIISLADPKVQRIAASMVDDMNRMLKEYPQCQKLWLHSISDASSGATKNFVKNTAHKFVDITVRLITRPGMGEFEATVRVHPSNKFELAGTISRTNQYGNQSRCIDNYNLKLYCYCGV